MIINKFSKIKDISTKHVSGNIIMINKIASRNLQTIDDFKMLNVKKKYFQEIYKRKYSFDAK